MSETLAPEPDPPDDKPDQEVPAPPPDSGYFSPQQPQSSTDDLFQFDQESDGVVTTIVGRNHTGYATHAHSSVPEPSAHAYAAIDADFPAHSTQFPLLGLERSAVYARRKTKSAPQLQPLPPKCGIIISSFQAAPSTAVLRSISHDSYNTRKIVISRRTNAAVQTDASGSNHSLCDECGASILQRRPASPRRVVGQVHPLPRDSPIREEVVNPGDHNAVGGPPLQVLIRSAAERLARIGDEIEMQRQGGHPVVVIDAIQALPEIIQLDLAEIIPTPEMISFLFQAVCFIIDTLWN